MGSAPNLEVINWENLGRAYALDGRLLETGYVFNTQFDIFPFWNCLQLFSWVVIYMDAPWIIRVFEIKDEEVFVNLEKIKAGEKIIHNCSYPRDLIEVKLLDVDEDNDIRLANCSPGTYRWLRGRPATQKIIDSMKKPIA